MWHVTCDPRPHNIEDLEEVVLTIQEELYPMQNVGQDEVRKHKWMPICNRNGFLNILT